MSRHIVPGARHSSPDDFKFCPHNIVSRVRAAADRQTSICAHWRKNHPRDPAVSFRCKPARSRLWPVNLSVVRTHVPPQLRDIVIEQQSPPLSRATRRTSDASQPYHDDVQALHDLQTTQITQYHEEWIAANARAAARQQASTSTDELRVAKQWAQCDVSEPVLGPMQLISANLTPQSQPAHDDVTRRASIEHLSALQVDIICDFQRRASMHNLPPRHVRPRLPIYAEGDVNINYFVYDKEPYANSSLYNDTRHVRRNSAGTELPPPPPVVRIVDSAGTFCESPQLMYPSPPSDSRKRKSRDDSVSPGGDRSAKRARPSCRPHSQTLSRR